jgi:hypothetical protein
MLYGFARRSVGKVTGRASVVAPVRVHAHHPRLLVAMAQMEMGQAAAKAVSAKLKALASLRSASLVGCPY